MPLLALITTAAKSAIKTSEISADPAQPRCSPISLTGMATIRRADEICSVVQTTTDSGNFAAANAARKFRGIS
jgi:hypothetical protein